MPQSVPNPTNAGQLGGEKVTELPPPTQRQPYNGVTSLVPTSRLAREHAPRWAPGERLNHLEEACIRFATNDAVIGISVALSHRDLNRRVNQLARHLLSRGIQTGARLVIMYDRTPETYVAMLALMKVNAAYVPLDADSFLMKGEIMDPRTEWSGNPAKLVRRHVARAEVYAKDSSTPLTETSSSRIEKQCQDQEGDR